MEMEREIAKFNSEEMRSIFIWSDYMRKDFTNEVFEALTPVIKKFISDVQSVFEEHVTNKNVLYVKINGHEYKARTEREVLFKIMQAWDDDALTAEEKLKITIMLFYQEYDKIPAKDYNQALETCVNFIAYRALSI